MIVPACCLPLLKEQRTHYRDHENEYGAEIQRTFDSFSHMLPANVESVLDIGCGMCGIDVLIGKRFPGAELWLLDKDGVSPNINAGYHNESDSFAHYHNFNAAFELLAANGIDLRPVVTVDINHAEFPQRRFDLVVSLLSWGFHYPIQAYAPNVARGGLMVVDVRKGTSGLHDLEEFGSVTVIHEAQKYSRAAVQC